MWMFKSKKEKEYNKLKKKKIQLDKLKIKLETADVFSKEKLEKQTNDLKEEIKKMALKIKDGKLVKDTANAEGVKIKPVEEVKNEPAAQEMAQVVKTEPTPALHEIPQPTPQQVSQPMQHPEPVPQPVQQPIPQPVQQPTGPSPFDQTISNEQYAAQQLEMQRVEIEEHMRREALAQQVAQQPIPPQQSSVHTMPPQPKVPQQPVPVKIEMTSGKVYEANIEVPVIEKFIQDINAAVEDQAPMRLGNITINGRYILSYIIKKK